MWIPKFDKETCAQIKKAIEDIGNDQIGINAVLTIWADNAHYEFWNTYVEMSKKSNSMFARLRPTHFKRVTVEDNWHGIGGEHLDIYLGTYKSNVGMSIDTDEIRRISVSWYDEDDEDDKYYNIYDEDEE